MDVKSDEVEKWGFSLSKLYCMALKFYKHYFGKAIHLSYEDNLKFIAFKQQAKFGAFNLEKAPELGVFDVIGRDRRLHWQMLGDITREQAMEGFIDLLATVCHEFRPYVEAVRKNLDETLKKELKRMEEEKLQQQQQQEQFEESYKEEIQRRQLQDALNRQTYHKFKAYAEKQFPGNPEQQAVLLLQLQQEHYNVYTQRLRLQQHGLAGKDKNQEQNDTGELLIGSDSNLSNNDKPQNSVDDFVDQLQLQNDMLRISHSDIAGNNTDSKEEETQKTNGDNTSDLLVVQPARMWTRPDINDFKAEVTNLDGDGVIVIASGDTVTVRVPTNPNGRCIFWEFATDSYDVGFGMYFEWSKPTTQEVTVHISDSGDEDDYLDEDNLSGNEDVECGERTDLSAITADDSAASKAPISIIMPIYRRECFNEVYVGSHVYPGHGVYLLKFDNSYSIWRSKTLYYRVYYESFYLPRSYD